MATSSETISLIIPVYNEEKILKEQLVEIRTFLDNAQFCYEVLIVENGSTDRTPEILNQIQEDWPQLTIAHLDKPNYGRAIQEGIGLTKHEKNFIINLDIWDEAFLIESKDKLDDYGLVIGSKRLKPGRDQRSGFRRFLSVGLNFLLKVLVGFQGTDTHGLKAFRKSAIMDIYEKIQLCRGMFDTELVIRCEKESVPVAEIPISVKETRPSRNPMVQKIAQNVVDIVKLTWIIRREY